MKNNLLGKKNCLKVLRLVLRPSSSPSMPPITARGEMYDGYEGMEYLQEAGNGFTETPNQALGLNGVNPSNNGYGYVKKAKIVIISVLIILTIPVLFSLPMRR